MAPRSPPRPSTCAASRVTPSDRGTRTVSPPPVSARSLRTVRAPAPSHDVEARRAGGDCSGGPVCLRPAQQPLGHGMRRTAAVPAAHPVPASSRLPPASAAVLAPAGSLPAAPTPCGSSSASRETSGRGIAAQGPDISTLRKPDLPDRGPYRGPRGATKPTLAPRAARVPPQRPGPELARGRALLCVAAR